MLEAYAKDELKEFSMLELGFHILKENKKPTPFAKLMEQVSRVRHLSEIEQKQRIAQFYTDINIDGRFVCIGDNQWGLKTWYPVESSEEELATTIKPKKRKTKKKSKAKLNDEEEFDNFEDDLEEEFDVLEDVIDDEDGEVVDQNTADYDYDEDEEEDEEEDEDEEKFEGKDKK